MHSAKQRVDVDEFIQN